MKAVEIIFLIILISSCGSDKEIASKQTNFDGSISIIDMPISTQVQSRIKGKVLDENGGLATYGQVVLLQSNTAVAGTMINSEGEFSFSKLEVGTYDLKVTVTGYEPVFVCCLVVKENQEQTVDVRLKKYYIQLEKPIIYIYPEKITSVQVKLDFKGQLDFTYPKYPQSGWNVLAYPDGKLVDSLGKEYYALFWEGTPEKQLVPSDGFVVSGEETVSFLEQKLAELGLNQREANEFILHWLPKMEKNAFNFIHFAGNEYTEMATLNIQPQPETLIRIMMLTYPLSSEIKVPLQDITPLIKKRNGFTVVEWGGSLISPVEN